MRNVDYIHSHLLNEWVWDSLSAVSSSGGPKIRMIWSCWNESHKDQKPGASVLWSQGKLGFSLKRFKETLKPLAAPRELQRLWGTVLCLRTQLY